MFKTFVVVNTTLMVVGMGFLLYGVHQLNKGQKKHMTDLSKVSTEVLEATTVMAGAAALITGLAQEIRDNITDQAALNDLADTLDASSNNLASVVAANTAAEQEDDFVEPEPIEPQPTPAEPAPAEPTEPTEPTDPVNQ